MHYSPGSLVNLAVNVVITVTCLSASQDKCFVDVGSHNVSQGKQTLFYYIQSVGLYKRASARRYHDRIDCKEVWSVPFQRVDNGGESGGIVDHSYFYRIDVYVFQHGDNLVINNLWRQCLHVSHPHGVLYCYCCDGSRAIYPQCGKGL